MTLLSRVFGFVRDMLMARFLGAGLEADAFVVAFKLPNFFRRLFAEGAFNQAFLPMFAGMLKTGLPALTLGDSSALAVGDSVIAIGWVGRRAAKTTLPRSATTEQAWQLLARAQQWLRQGRPGAAVEIRKWPTRRWGEIPADFGRK